MDSIPDYFFIPVLSVAGSDPSGGAGVQSDIKTCEAFGCYGMAAVSALTAQSPHRVFSTFSTSHFLQPQLSALLEEVRPRAVKTGMLPDANAVESVASAIIDYLLTNIVVDPVIASSSGLLLTDEEAIRAMRTYLFPLATILTPNLPEAELLTGRRITTFEEAKRAAIDIASLFGCRSVLIKGGHARQLIDILYMPERKGFHIFHSERVSTPNTHGTGCRLSTAIACCLAMQSSDHPDIPSAVYRAKQWLTNNLKQFSNTRFKL